MSTNKTKKFKKNNSIFSLIQMKMRKKEKINSNQKLIKTFITIGLGNNSLKQRKTKDNQINRMKR